MGIIFLPAPGSARVLAAVTLASVMAGAPVAAQTGDEAKPPAFSSSPASPPPSSSSSEETGHFVATAAPTAYFIATASRLALGNSRNGKIRKLAETLAREQSQAANSLASWVNVNSAVVTLRSPFTGKIGPGAPRLSAPNLLPSQVSDLHRLSPLQGKEFDTVFVSVLMGALVQLQALYGDFIRNGTDPGLRAIAERESPKVDQAILELGKL